MLSIVRDYRYRSFASCYHRLQRRQAGADAGIALPVLEQALRRLEQVSAHSLHPTAAAGRAADRVSGRRRLVQGAIDELYRQLVEGEADGPSQRALSLARRLKKAARTLDLCAPAERSGDSRQRALDNWRRLLSRVRPLVRSDQSVTIEGAATITMVDHYWPETLTFSIDGVERHLYITKLRPYINEWKEDATTDPFQEWMQAKIDDMAVADDDALAGLRANSVLFVDAASRQRHTVTFHGGQPLLGGLPMADGDYIFALANVGTSGAPLLQLRAGKKVKGQFQHSSLFAGGPVVSAGFMKVRVGRIAMLNNYSGHYQTGWQSLRTVRHFLSMPGNMGTAAHKVRLRYVNNWMWRVYDALYSWYLKHIL